MALLTLAACGEAGQQPETVEERVWVSLPDDAPRGYTIRENDLVFAVYCSEGHVYHMVSAPVPFSVDDGFYMGSTAGTLSDWACNDEHTLCGTMPPALPRVRDEIVMFSQLGQPQAYAFYMEGTNITRSITLDWGSFPGGMRSFILRCQANSPDMNATARNTFQDAADQVRD